MSEDTLLYPSHLLKDDYGTTLMPEDFSTIPSVNGHIHSPHSFSAFSDIRQAFQMARDEGISVLGINDFYTTDGFAEFAENALASKVFPLFNIEFMALQKEEQQAGIRINDPVNPGRTYMSGKGLRFPVSMGPESRAKLDRLQTESNRQTYQMVEKLNSWLRQTSTGLWFDAIEIQQKLAKNLLRERHIATAVRLAVFEKYGSEMVIKNTLQEIYGGKSSSASIQNIPALENEIRNNLLKAGGPAYVAEDEEAFLSLEEVNLLIRDAGGIPCYPVLLDDVKGNFTDFEKDWEKMAESLAKRSVFMVELIPGRNDFHILKDFVRFFYGKGFIVSFGSEHNTPQLEPLTINCRGGIPLDDELKQISYEGTAIIAAHQFLTAHGKPGFPSGGFINDESRNYMKALGTRVIFNLINQIR